MSPGDPTGGAPAARAARTPATVLAGTIDPARPGARLHVQRRTGARWVRSADALVARGGRYSVRVSGPGVYRVVYGAAIGPAVRVG
jgi:hypothetical protein